MKTVVSAPTITSNDKVVETAIISFEDVDMSDPREENQLVISLEITSNITQTADVTDAAGSFPSVWNQSVQALGSRNLCFVE